MRLPLHILIQQLGLMASLEPFLLRRGNSRNKLSYLKIILGMNENFVRFRLQRNASYLR